jgi:8-oxo-dGTP pyrophosphatase MutT (NUDIX family)
MYDETDDVFAQSAAIPFVLKNRTPRLLLITSRKRKRWIVPKGIVEHWQTPEEAAREEAWEEAGVRGRIVGGAVGTYEYGKWGGKCRVDVFLLRVEEILDEWPESDYRDRKWVDKDEALQLVDNLELRRLIRRAVGFITPPASGEPK